MLTEEQKKEIENLYNYYWKLYLEQKEDKDLYLGIEEVLRYLGCSFKKVFKIE